MAKSWYILQTFTGYEHKIERVLNKELEDGSIDGNVLTTVKVPEEEITTVRKDKNGNNKNIITKNLILPGYVMLEMDLPQIGWKDTCSKIRRIQGVAGFVGTNPSERPRPIGDDEARNILQQAGEIKGEKVVRVNQSYEVGDKVKITDGPFASFNGTVEEVNSEKNKLRVVVEIFGRATPVEVDILQVEKI